MSSVVALKTPGRYLALFHDDGRYFRAGLKQSQPIRFTLYQSISDDGGLHWSAPKVVQTDTAVHLCEPGAFRSPDKNEIAICLRENRRLMNSHVMFSNDEADTWSKPTALPASLTGDRHTAVYLRDGRLFISFRDMDSKSPWRGDWVAWVGRYEDLASGGVGELKIRLLDNRKGTDCGYSGVELLPDGTVVSVSYGHFTENESPYIVAVHIPPAILAKP